MALWCVVLGYVWKFQVCDFWFRFGKKDEVLRKVWKVQSFWNLAYLGSKLSQNRGGIALSSLKFDLQKVQKVSKFDLLKFRR